MSAGLSMAGERRVRLSQEERRAISTRRIIDAALRTIALRGVAGASLAEIGVLAGFSRGLPAHLFGNKDRLLKECLRRLLEDYWIDGLPKIGVDGAFAALSATIHRWIADLSAYPERARAHFLLLQEANMADAEVKFPHLAAMIRDHAMGSERRFHAYIEAGQANGEIDPRLDARFEAMSIHSTLRGVSLRWVIEPNSIDVDRFADQFVDRLAVCMLVRAAHHPQLASTTPSATRR